MIVATAKQAVPSHKAGEKLFVDYAGESVKIHNRKSVKFQRARIFVAVLGASNYTYCEASWTEGHRDHLYWTPSRLIDWAATTGPATANLVAGIMDQRSYPEQGYRSCSGIMRLSKLCAANRVEAASQRAILIGAFRYSSVHSILKKGLDRHPLSKPEPTPQLEHENIRGAHYYQ